MIQSFPRRCMHRCSISSILVVLSPGNTTFSVCSQQKTLSLHTFSCFSCACPRVSRCLLCFLYLFSKMELHCGSHCVLQVILFFLLFYVMWLAAERHMLLLHSGNIKSLNLLLLLKDSWTPNGNTIRINPPLFLN